jgi:hypothetical protein
VRLEEGHQPGRVIPGRQPDHSLLRLPRQRPPAAAAAAGDGGAAECGGAGPGPAGPLEAAAAGLSL